MLLEFASSVLTGIGIAIGICVVLVPLRFAKRSADPVGQEVLDYWNESLSCQERAIAASGRLHKSIIDLIEKHQ